MICTVNFRGKKAFRPQCWVVAYRAWGYAVVRIDGYAGLQLSRFAVMRLGDGRVYRACGFVVSDG